MKLEVDPVKHDIKPIPEKQPERKKEQSPEFEKNQDEENYFEQRYETGKSGQNSTGNYFTNFTFREGNEKISDVN